MTGTLVLAGAAGLGRAADPALSSRAGRALIGAAGAGLIGAAVFATDPVSGYPPGPPDALTQPSRAGMMHNLAAIPVFLGLPAAAFTCSRQSIRAGHRGFGRYCAATATTMLATMALAGAGFNQSPRLVNLAGLFQRASIVTGFGWLTALSAQALTRAPALQPANRQPESAAPAFHRTRNAAKERAQLRQRLSVPTVGLWQMYFITRTCRSPLINQLREHFAPVLGPGERDRHLRYYLASVEEARKYDKLIRCGDRPTPAQTRLGRQMEKDERFWLATALMSLYHADDGSSREKSFARLLERAGLRPPPGFPRWEDALAGALDLFFEVNLPSPGRYRAWLRDHLGDRTPDPLPQKQAEAPGARLEGTTKADAMLLAPATGVAVIFEAKVLSDISTHVTFDLVRDQPESVNVNEAPSRGSY